MQAQNFQSGRGWLRPGARRRAVAILITLLIEILFLAAFLFAVRTNDRRAPQSSLSTFNVGPEPQAEHVAEPKTRAAAKEKALTPPVKEKHPPLPTPPRPDGIVPLSKEDFAASDIGKLLSHGTAKGNSASTYGPGEGPGGVPLYRAEWYREPRDAELAFYLPPSRPPGSWAEIMCRTVDNYHVDNCRSLGESPPGSGLAKALRLASWQFLVRPPRVGDKPAVGAWVRIHFSFTKEREG